MTRRASLVNLLCWVPDSATRSGASLVGWVSRRFFAGVTQHLNDRMSGYAALNRPTHCLASGALALSDAPAGIKRNMPDLVPMAILGRLAVDQTWQGHGMGAGPIAG